MDEEDGDSMNCPEETSLNKLVDGELDRPEADRLRAHIDGCAICGESLARIEKLRNEVKTAIEAEVNDRDLSHITWYAVLACYKLGIILEGTHARAFAGKAPKAIGDFLHDTTLLLFERALNWLN